MSMLNKIFERKSKKADASPSMAELSQRAADAQTALMQAATRGNLHLLEALASQAIPQAQINRIRNVLKVEPVIRPEKNENPEQNKNKEDLQAGLNIFHEGILVEEVLGGRALPLTLKPPVQRNKV